MSSDSLNILIVHIAGLTQTALALPALRSLRSHFPQSRITIVSSTIAADLLKLAEVADEILPLGRFKYAEMIKPRTLYRGAKIWNELRNSNYDLAIELKSGPESAIVLQLANPRSRLGQSRVSKGRGGLGILAERVRQILVQRPPVHIHLAHEYLKLLEPLNVRPVESEPRLTTDRAADALIEKLLQKHRVQLGELLIGVHPGAGGSRQRWPLERFASIASRMINNYGARILVFAGPHESGDAKKLSALLPAKRAITIESPKLAEFASAAARLSLLVANLSGPAHLAAAVGTPVVAVSATSNPSAEDLLGKRHEQIRGSHLTLISEEEVYEAACRLLKMNRAEFLGAR